MRHVQRLSEAELDAFVTIAVNAYPGFGIQSEEDRQRLVQRLRAQTADPIASFYGLFQDGRLLGGMKLFDFTMTLHSVQVPAGGVGFVAVDLMHKKQKVARDMIHFYLEHYRRQGSPIALLYPFRPDFYRQMGFGYGTKMDLHHVRPASLPGTGAREHVAFVTSEARSEVLDCYTRVAERTHGMLAKTMTELDRMFSGPGNRVAAYRHGGRITGYMVFHFKSVTPENFVLNDLEVTEFIYEDREALAGLLAFLHMQADQINRIIITTQDEDFHFALTDPRNGTDRLIPSVYHESNTQGVGIMYRVLDTRAIFEALRAHSFGGQTCRLKVNIIDTFLEPHNDAVTIQFTDGLPRLAEDGAHDVEIRLDVAEFSSLLMGTVSFTSLHTYGLAEISDTAYLDTVDRLFHVHRKPVCTTPF